MPVTLLSAGLTSCSDSAPEPDPVARTRWPSGLASGKLGQVPVTGVTRKVAQQQLTDATAGLGGLRPEVRVTRVRPGKDDEHATAVLTQRWTVPGTGAVWQYSTRAPLVRTDDRWQVRWTPAVIAPDLVTAERLVLTRVAPKRGDVLGGDGAPLVTARPVVRLGIDKTKVAAEQAEASATALAGVVGVDAAAFAERVGKSGPKAFVEAVVLRATDAPDPSAYAGIAGAVGIDDELPLAPTRDFARPVLGSVGAATAELVKDSDGRLVPGDITGLSGLQKRYDEQLRGRSGVVVRAVTPPAQEGATAAARELFRTEAVDGTPLATTLDERLQRLAETTLADVRPASAIVAVRPSDGQSLPRPAAPARAASPPPRSAGSRRGRRSRWSPRSRCCGPG